MKTKIGRGCERTEVYRENRALKILEERHGYRINILGVVRRK